MRVTLAVIVNKGSGGLAPSETFLLSHIRGLPCSVLPVIGNPNYRRLGVDGSTYLASRAPLPLAIRWSFRQLGLASAASQDSRAVRAFLHRNKIDIVLAEYGPTAVSVMEACRQASVPLVAHFHGYDAYRHDILQQHAADYRRLFQQAAAVVAVSSHMRDQLLSLGAVPGRTFHNSCGADVPVNLRAQPESSEARFLMVGRLVEKKAPFLSILAFARVAARFADAQLEVIGDGPLKAACEQLAKALGIDDRVRFLGASPHSEVLTAMSRARCFIQHSVQAPDGDREGTPVGVLEAMGMGLPVVATRHGGILDVVKDGHTGSLVAEYDVEGMGAAMMRFAEDPAAAREMGESARTAVLEDMTSEKSVARLWTIVQGALSKGAVGASPD